MNLSYLEIALLIMASFALGGMLTYLSLKLKIKLLKEALHSLDNSLKGMWDTNEQWQKKYTALEKTKQLDLPERTERDIVAKHASDDSIALKETIS